MRDSNSRCCITRVVDGDDHDVQLAQLQTVMQRLQTALHDIPATQRVYLANTLLYLAVSRMSGEAPAQRLATLLMGLSAPPSAPDSPRTVDPGVWHG